MFTSFSTALSALNAHSTAIDVVGNNLANLNTPGYKASVVSFHDMVTQSLGAALGETQVGFGVGRPTTLRQFSQGAIQSSSAPLDAAIQGDGFFVVKDATGATLYTRGGNLQVNKEGALVTSTGQKIQGWTNFSGQVDTNAPVGDVVIPMGTLMQAKATQSMSMDVNLNAAAVVGTADDTFSTSMEVYDSLGTSHVVSLKFQKTAANTWDYTASVPDADFASPFTPVTGTLVFDGNGKLQTPDAAGGSIDIPLNGLVDGASDFTVKWNLYDGATPRLTQYSQKSAPSALAQDGSGSASLIRVGIADGGKIVAQYSNGAQNIVGQIAMALVRNPESLIAVGDSNYSLSARSAIPSVGLPNTGGRGSILGGAVESSTSDVAREFTNLIVFQRGYQANARVITAVDEMSQETINLKH